VVESANGHPILHSELLEIARKNEQKALDLLRQLVRFPSVANRDKQSILECANLIEEQLTSRGFKSTQFPTEGSPVVFGEKSVGARKTLLFYQHYDVQPEDPIDAWESSPWEVSVREGRAYGRGAFDNKGPLVANLLGMDLIERALGEIPVNVKFVVEGEEEAGSAHLPSFASANRDFLKADGCVMEIATAAPGVRSEIQCGAKGTVYFELVAGGTPRFPGRDVHSGYAGGVPNAAWRLVWALSSLKDEKENILIDGVNELVEPPTEEDLRALSDFGEDLTDMLRGDYGLGSTLLGRSGLELATAVFMKPSITISGVTTGYQGPGGKTIVPSTASAKVDFRLVPKLTAQKAEDLFRAHLKKKGFDDIQVTKAESSYDPARTPVDHPFVRMIHNMSKQVATPAHARLAPISFGSGPNYLFVPHAPCCLAVSQTELTGTNFHAPNENIPLSSMTNTMAFAAALAERLALA